MYKCYHCGLHQRVKTPQHIIHIFIHRAKGILFSFFIIKAFIRLLSSVLLWPLVRKAKVNKGQDRCQIKQLLNRELGCDPQIRNGDLSQQQGKTFLQLLLLFYEIQSRFAAWTEKKLISFICVLIFSTLHIGVVLRFPPWLYALNHRHVRGKLSGNLEWGGTPYLSGKLRMNQQNTKMYNITLLKIAWNVHNLWNSSDFIQQCFYFFCNGLLVETNFWSVQWEVAKMCQFISIAEPLSNL